MAILSDTSETEGLLQENFTIKFLINHWLARGTQNRRKIWPGRKKSRQSFRKATRKVVNTN